MGGLTNAMLPPGWPSPHDSWERFQQAPGTLSAEGSRYRGWMDFQFMQIPVCAVFVSLISYDLNYLNFSKISWQAYGTVQYSSIQQKCILIKQLVTVHFLTENIGKQSRALEVLKPDRRLYTYRAVVDDKCLSPCLSNLHLSNSV